MARPERNNVDYFPFYCDDGKKMFYIEETYGNDGFACFVKLLKELAKTDYHFLDLSQKTTQMFLSAKCKISLEKMLLIIDDLAELGKFNIMLWKESKVIWCQDFIEGIQDAYKKRSNDCITFDGLLILLDSLGVRKLSKDNINSPVKPQRKEEYNKEDKSKLNNDLDFIKDLGFRDLFLRWVNYKKERKEKYKSIDSLKTSFKKLEKYSSGELSIATEIIENSIANNYAGFFELKTNQSTLVKPQNNKGVQSTLDTYERLKM